MFILPPNCIVPSATSLTMSPVLPNFRYFIAHTPSAGNTSRDTKARIGAMHLVYSWMSTFMTMERGANARHATGSLTISWLVYEPRRWNSCVRLSPLGFECRTLSSGGRPQSANGFDHFYQHCLRVTVHHVAV